MKKNIIITGGAGFIGSHLCEKLSLEGHTIYCIDNLLTGSYSNIEKLDQKYDNFHFIEQDICDPFDFKADQVYNLACPASPLNYQQHPISTLKTNFIGVLNCLEICKKYGAKLLHASTSEVYGDPLIHPQTEDYNGNVSLTGPRACYDEGKRVAETLIFNYHYTYNLSVKIPRIFNTYGPKMHYNDGRMAPAFIYQALNNLEITIFGDGLQTRSLCYVDDLIEGLHLFMNSSQDITGPINLGNPSEITVLDFAKKVINITNSNSKITFHALPENDPLKRKPCINKAEELLNWSPKVSLDDGLIKVRDYFKKSIVKS